jgi:hypothetical protein
MRWKGSGLQFGPAHSCVPSARRSPTGDGPRRTHVRLPSAPLLPCRDGALRGGVGYEEILLRQLTTLRGEYFSIGDYAAGRMPLAYVQLMQVLVDSLVVLAPFALYPELGTVSIPLTGLLTLFFKGLLELSKSFLDPFGTEGFPGQNIRVDVLVSELTLEPPADG